MTVSAKRDALLDFFPRLRVRTLLGQMVDGSLGFVADDVVKINHGRMRKPAERTFLRRLELHPQLAIIAAVFSRTGHVFLFVSLVPALICLSIFNFPLFRILVRHLLDALSPVKTMDVRPGIARLEQLVPAPDETIRTLRVCRGVGNDPGVILALGVHFADGNHALL